MQFRPLLLLHLLWTLPLTVAASALPFLYGAIVGVVVGAVLITGWLGSKYQHYPAGIDCSPAVSRADCEYG